MEMSCLPHRGIRQHHRVIAIKIKSSFKSLVQNYELKSRTLGLEFRDLEKANESWSHPNVNATALALQLEQQEGCRTTAGNEVALGTPGAGTHLCLLDGVGRSLGHTRQRGGGWMDLAVLAMGISGLCCHNPGAGEGTDPLLRDRMETHPWLPSRAVPVAGSDAGQVFPCCAMNVLF